LRVSLKGTDSLNLIAQMNFFLFHLRN
jgi:hypothetical protein